MKTNLSNVFKTVKKGAKKHAPEILTGIGIAGMWTTVVLASKATPKALALIEAKKEEQEVEKLTVVDTVKTTWKCYIPAAATGILSTACLIGGSREGLKRNAALATAYKLSESAFTEYRDKVIENIGGEAEHKLREEISKEKAEATTVEEEFVYVTGRGDDLMYDPFGKRYFRSSVNEIERAVNKLNHDMAFDMFGSASLNDFYEEINLGTIAYYDEIGWDIRNGLVEPYLTSFVSKNGKAAITLGFDTPPAYLED